MLASVTDLLRPGAPRVYAGEELNAIAFPLGGLGTGSLSLGGWGQLTDFEIFNRPSKGLQFGHTFFALFAQREGQPGVTRLLQGPVGGDFFTERGTGLPQPTAAGLPRCEAVTFTGMFPLARLDFTDSALPLAVALEAYNPFIPLNPDDSGLPAALFNLELHNPNPQPVRAVFYASLENRVGHPEVGGGVNSYFAAGGARGLKFETTRHAPDSPRYGSLALATPHADLAVQTHLFRGRWYDALQRYTDEMQAGVLTEDRAPAAGWPRPEAGALALRVMLAPGARARLPVWIIWHTPNFEMYWSEQDPKPVWRNHYATRFADAVAVAAYLGQHHARLETETRRFTQALFTSTLPAAVLDAVSSQISILKTNTCLRLTDGTFYGWEGCYGQAGSCEGSCTHVWNYAQALPFLFPSLERSMRAADYAYNQQPNGHMTFRLPLPLGTRPAPNFFAAADGQLGGLLKLYRDWQLCGDDDWLRALWPAARRALAYAWTEWDQDQDGVIEGVQHNTYDIEFFGPNTLVGSFYLGALRAAEEIARHLGAPAEAERYRALFEQGRARMDVALFNGEYYVQAVAPPGSVHGSFGAEVSMGGFDPDPRFPNYPRYQYGAGCLSDQLIGQWLAQLTGLGDLFDPAHVRSALAAVYRHNWKPSLLHHANAQRVFAANTEAGLINATWPRGGRPGLPFVYADEVWSGIEYQVAGHLIYAGYLTEGLSIVQGTRDRYTGVHRNPWNEIECGHHYARSLASYALLLALSDFHYSAVTHCLSFAPRVYPDQFACFFSVEGAWGQVKQARAAGALTAAVEVASGGLLLHTLEVGWPAAAARAALGGRPAPLSAEVVNGRTRLHFDPPVFVSPAAALTVTADA
ncbi:MAG: hypothetical protein IT317_03690 [Anaerolineales bacterium]|nr:hypothetical protein [Anaerolineales bacterium]